MKIIKVKSNSGKLLDAYPVTREEWDKAQGNHKQIIDGVKHLTHTVAGWPMLRPVYIKESARLAYCDIDKKFTWEIEKDGLTFRSDSFDSQDEANQAIKAGVQLLEYIPEIDAPAPLPRQVITIQTKV